MEKQLDLKTVCDVPSFWKEYKNELRSFIFKRVKDHDLTNDILQEVLIKAYNFCSSKSGIRNIRSWLFQIAHNTIIDSYRKQAKFIGKERGIELAEEDENSAFSEAANYILPILDFLPRKYAEPLKLADIDGLKQADIAQKIGLNISATKSRIQRARKLLKEEFKTCCFLELDRHGKIISFEIKDSCKPLQKIKQEIQK